MTHMLNCGGLPTVRRKASVEKSTIQYQVTFSFFFLTVEEADITFSVETTEDHDLQFQWQKDGTDIDSDEYQFPASRTGHSSTLRIQCVEKSDKGHYKCLVKSPVEKSRRKSLHTAELQVCKFIATYINLNLATTIC